jgi:hypothetical protein
VPGAIIMSLFNFAFENNSIDTCRAGQLVFATQWQVEFTALILRLPRFRAQFLTRVNPTPNFSSGGDRGLDLTFRFTAEV